MSVQINKDTKLYGSFSINPVNNGCLFFNEKFESNGINAIYKSFYSDDIEKTIAAVKHLNFSGFALSNPHKISVIPFLDAMDDVSYKIGAVNTVLNYNGMLKGFNTDYFGVMEFFKLIDFKEPVNILGTGGFSKAIQHVCKDMNITYSLIRRNNFIDIYNKTNEIFINATPIDIILPNNTVIDLRPHTDQGKQVAKFQAEHQFKLYTNQL